MPTTRSLSFSSPVDAQEKPRGGNFFINGFIWLNNNDDSGQNYPYGSANVPTQKTDSSADFITSARDLEDWTRLWIYTKGLNTAIQSGQIMVGLKWKKVVSGNPGITLAPAKDTDGGLGYLTKLSNAQAQVVHVLYDNSGITKNVIPTSGSADFVFPQSVWNNLSESSPKTFFIFEGTQEGFGQLEIVFLKSDGTTLLGEGGSVWLDLHDVKEMYERAQGSPQHIAPPYYLKTPFAGPTSLTRDVDGIAFQKAYDEDSNAIVFVHGWDMSLPWDYNFSETMFKRLWWQGYKGRFCMFRWDPLLKSWPVEPNPGTQPAGQYNRSEDRAFAYGSALKQYVDQLNAQFSVTVISHSMGAAVTISAFKQGLTCTNYVAMESALPASCYNPNYAHDSTLDKADASTPTPLAVMQNGYQGYFPATSVPAKIFNFYNPNDYALQTGQYYGLQTNWRRNQVAYKPDGTSGDFIGNFAHPDDWAYNYYASSNTAVVKCSTANIGNYSNGVYSRSVTDPWECMSFVSRSRTLAVGASAGVFSNVSSATDLPLSAYGFDRQDFDHSGQTQRPAQETTQLYIDLLTNIGLKKAKK